MREVEIGSWPLSDVPRDRTERLHFGPEPAVLLNIVLSEAESAANLGKLRIAWEDSCERLGFGRLSGLIPLSEGTFDQLFNGRSGYRAQYYLSPEEGILFNRDIVTGLVMPIEIAYRVTPLNVPFELLHQSLISPHSKIWVFDEKAAFDEAVDDALNPPRWVDNRARRGRKAPLPTHLTIELKGAFLHPDSRELFVDDLKLERPFDLFNKGYT